MKSLFGKSPRIVTKAGCATIWFRGVILIAVVGIVGALYQYVSAVNDRKLYPPPGQLVDVGGYRLHLYCIGEGNPPIILEAGSGNKGVIAWSLVQKQLAATTQVCSYDRAGIGWSEPDPVNQPRNSSKVAETLHTLLHNAGIEGPYVLVGHSFGGFHVRNFAYQYPTEVAGVVLLDSALDNVFLTVMQRNSTEDFFEDVGWKYCSLLTATGVTRLFGETKLASPLGLPASERGRYPLPESLYQADLANRRRTHYCRSAELEFLASIKDGTQSAPTPPLGDLPLLVVTVGTDPAWNEMQNKLADLSTDSTHIVVENGDHYIQFFQPDVVIDVVNQMVSKVRAKP